jgi:hypothetical protein
MGCPACARRGDEQGTRLCPLSGLLDYTTRLQRLPGIDALVEVD